MGDAQINVLSPALQGEISTFLNSADRRALAQTSKYQEFINQNNPLVFYSVQVRKSLLINNTITIGRLPTSRTIVYKSPLIILQKPERSVILPSYAFTKLPTTETVNNFFDDQVNNMRLSSWSQMARHDGDNYMQYINFLVDCAVSFYLYNVMNSALVEEERENPSADRARELIEVLFLRVLRVATYYSEPQLLHWRLFNATRLQKLIASPPSRESGEHIVKLNFSLNFMDFVLSDELEEQDVEGKLESICEYLVEVGHEFNGDDEKYLDLLQIIQKIGAQNIKEIMHFTLRYEFNIKVSVNRDNNLGKLNKDETREERFQRLRLRQIEKRREEMKIDDRVSRSGAKQVKGQTTFL